MDTDNNVMIARGKDGMGARAGKMDKGGVVGEKGGVGTSVPV